MNLISAFASYFIIWWITLFAVLPFGLRTQEEAGDIVLGTHASAPAKPRFLLVISITTIIAGMIFGGLYWFTITKGLQFDDLLQYFPDFMKPPHA